MPTPEQLAQVKENVSNMITLTNHVHSFESDKVNEVYLALQADQQTDPGQKFVSNLLDAVFWSIGAFEFTGATVFSSFLGTFFGAYAGPDAPPSLGAAFAGVVARLDATIQQGLTDLGAIHDDPAAYWNKTYTNPLNSKTAPVSSLGDGKTHFPSKDSELYQEITKSLVSRFRYELTMTQMSGLYRIYYSDYYSSYDYWTKEEWFTLAHKYISDYPAYFFKWRNSWVTSSGKRRDVIQYFNFSLCHANLSSTAASSELCNWLFQDDGFGKQTNPDGVAKRRDVFFHSKVPLYFPYGYEPFGPGGLNGMHEGDDGGAAAASASPQLTVEQLFDEHPRYTAAKKLIAELTSDPSAAGKLRQDPLLAEMADVKR